MRLLLAVDVDSAHAVAAAATRLFPDAECVVFSVAPVQPVLVPDTPMTGAALGVPSAVAIEAAEASSEAAVAAAHDELDDPSARARTSVGDPGEAICDEAARIDAGAIVIGRTERGWFSRLVEPSTAAYVIAHAPCPVVVVPHD